MAQAGIHGLVGMAVRKWAPQSEWLVLGIVLGNLFPDTDNLAVAAATVAKLPTEGLHRTFTHSLFTILTILVIFYLVAVITKKPRWKTLGIGLGTGVLMHILLDLLIWFNGVEILWPIPSWVNLWEGISPGATFELWMLTAEFLLIGLYFLTLDWLARRQKTNANFLTALRTWMIASFALFVVLTGLGFLMKSGFQIIAGAFYLVMLGAAMGVTIRMRQTIEAKA